MATLQRFLILALTCIIIHSPSLAQEDTKKKQKPRFYNRVFALCIGIERYLSDGIPKTDLAINDAETVAKMLNEHYGYETEILTGTKATKSAILGRIDELNKVLVADDALLLFFAGHGHIVERTGGARSGYLIPYDAQLDLSNDSNPDEWEKQAINMRSLSTSLVNLKAKHVLVVLDACCSGYMTKRGNFLERPDLQQLASLPSRAVISASTQNQAAYSSSNLNHGIFTNSLLSNLKSREAQSIGEVFTSIRQQVAIDSKGSMMPQMGNISLDDGEFVFIPLSIKEAEIKEAVVAVDARTMKRRGLGTTINDLIEIIDTEDYSHAQNAASAQKSWKSKAEKFQKYGATSDPLALSASMLTLARGLGVNKNHDHALNMAKLAFDTDHPAGYFSLAFCHLFGIGTQRNHQAALELLQTPGIKEFPLTDYLMAMMLLERDSTSVPAALKLLERASKSGLKAAKHAIIRLKLGSEPPTISKEDAIKELIPIADDKHRPSQELIYQLILKRSDLSSEDVAMALKYMNMAAALGSKDAAYHLAVEHYRLEWFVGRLPVKQDFVAARRWANIAADQGSGKAHQMLAMIYKKGQGVEKDRQQGQKHYQIQEKIDTDTRGEMGRWWIFEALEN